MFTTYDAKDCSVLINKVNITGLSEQMVTGSKDEENFSTSVGAQADVCCLENNNPLGTIKVAVQATCPQLASLLLWANSKKIFPIWVTNKKLNERFGGSKARIKKVADIEWGASAGDREFEITVFDYVNEPIKNKK